MFYVILLFGIVFRILFNHPNVHQILNQEVSSVNNSVNTYQDILNAMDISNDTGM